MRSDFGHDYGVNLPELEIDFVEEMVDTQIEYSDDDRTGKNSDSWLPFSENWTEIIPFKDLSEGCNGKVYVIQCKPNDSKGWKRVYVGSTFKEIDERYDEHINPKYHDVNPTEATKFHYSADPIVGFRWELMARYHDVDVQWGFCNKNSLRHAEYVLSSELSKAGFKVFGDWGQYGRNTSSSTKRTSV